MASPGTTEKQLKQRILELEHELLSIRERHHKTTTSSRQEDEQDEAMMQLKLQLVTAETNNEILANNVETLRALSLQLAVQLEDANVRLTTSQEQLEISKLRQERDVNEDMNRMRQEYEKRLETMRKALQAEEEATRQTVIMWENREEAAERRLLALERDKDRVISSLSHEIEVLRNGLTDGIDRSLRPSLKSTSVGVVAPSLGRHPLPSSSSYSCDFGISMSNLIVLSVALPTTQADALRFGEDERMPATIRGVKRKFHVDIIADPTVVEAVELPPQLFNENDDSRSPPRIQGDASPPRLDSGHRTQRWAFRLPSGEQIVLSAQVL